MHAEGAEVSPFACTPYMSCGQWAKSASAMWSELQVASGFEPT
jgi:hypothetical protein